MTVGDQDWFKFSISGQVYYFKIRGFSSNSIGGYGLRFSRSGGAVEIETLPIGTAEMAVDTFVELYEADATTRITYNDDGGQGALSFLTHDLFAQFRDVREPNDDYSQATDMGSGTSFTDNRLILAPGDQDWFRFTYNSKIYYAKVRGYSQTVTGNYGFQFSRSGSVVTLDTLSVNNSNTDTYIELYDSDHVTLIGENDDIRSGNIFSHLVVDLARDQYEPNNDRATAYNISNVTAWQTNRAYLAAGEEDWFRFSYNGNTYYFRVVGFDGAVSGQYGINFSRTNSTVRIETFFAFDA